MRKKAITQTLIYLIEVALFIILIISLYSKYKNDEFFTWSSEIFTLNFLSAISVMYVFYQLLIYSIFTLSDAAKNDALLQINSMIKMTILGINDQETLEQIKGQLNLFLNEKPNHYMFSDQDILALKNLQEFIRKYENKEIDNTNFLLVLEKMLVLNEHSNEFNKLLWRNSIILRYFK